MEDGMSGETQAGIRLVWREMDRPSQPIFAGGAGVMWIPDMRWRIGDIP